MTNVIKHMIAPINPACLISILVENRYVKVSITSKISEQIEIQAQRVKCGLEGKHLVVFFRGELRAHGVELFYAHAVFARHCATHGHAGLNGAGKSSPCSRSRRRMFIVCSTYSGVANE